MRFLRSNLLIVGLLAGAFAAPAGLAACGDDDTTNTPQPDASTVDTGVADTSPEDVVVPPQDASDAAQFGTYSLGLRIFELKNQPKATIPNVIYPVPFILVSPRAGGRLPDAATLGAGPPPLGCVAYNYSTLDPNDPKGPKNNAGNAGNILISGFTGGTVNLPPRDGGADSGDAGDGGPPRLPNPLACARINVPPGSTQFLYGCQAPRTANTFPLLYAPTSDFLANTDLITWTGTGGPDVPAFGNGDAGMAPAEDNTTITEDLWALAPADVDGTKDLVFHYSCGGSPCTKPARLGITITTTDTAPGVNVYDFPPPTKEYGQVVCEDLTAASTNSSQYTVRKELLAQIPKSWKTLVVTVGMSNFTGILTSNGTPIGVSAGTQTFAVVRHP